MENRRKIEIAFALLLIVLFIALALWLLRRDQQVPSGTQTPGVRNTPVSKEVSQVDPEDIPAPEEVAATTIARSFVERFGSYSSETDYVNVEDVIPLATSGFAQELQGIADRARRSAGSGYYGISTLVLSTKTTKQSADAMTLLVMTQREEAIGSPSDVTVRYQNIVVDLEKVGTEWRVGSFTWQD